MYSTKRSLSRLAPLDLARWVLPLAAWAAIRSLVVVQDDPAAQAETRFLALWVGTVLVALAGFTGGRNRREGELLWTAVFATAAAWIAPPAPLRGALVGGVLVLGLLTAVGRTWLDARGRFETAGRMGTGTLVPLALACQLLARSDLLLPPLLDLRTLVSVLMLPTLCGTALSLLARRTDGRRVLLAGAAVLVLSPGWNVSTTLGRVARAVGARLEQKPTAGPRARAPGFLVLALVAFWNFPVGAFSSLAGWILAGGRKAAVPALALAALVVAQQGVPGGRSLAVFMIWLGGVALVPAVVLAPLGERSRVAAGLLLALAGAAVGQGSGQGPETLAGGLALAALGLPLRGAGATLQRCWSGVVVTSCLLLAAYPWVRQAPREDLLVLLGLGGSAVLIPLALVVGLGLLLDLLGRRVGGGRVRPEVVVAGLLLGVAVTSAEPSFVLVDNYRATVLDAEHRVFRKHFPAQRVGTVVVETNLVQGLALPPGTTVGIVKLHAADGQRRQRWNLKVGPHTGEWAAARPDVAARANLVTPAPWLSQLAPDGTFFSRRYRTHLDLKEGMDAISLELTLHPALPPGVQLVIYRVELRP